MTETVTSAQLCVGGLRARFTYLSCTLQGVLVLCLDLRQCTSFRSDSDTLLGFRRDDILLILKGSFKRMPSKARALDPKGVLTHAREGRKFPQVVHAFRGFSRDKIVKLGEVFFNFVFALAF